MMTRQFHKILFTLTIILCCENIVFGCDCPWWTRPDLCHECVNLVWVDTCVGCESCNEHGGLYGTCDDDNNNCGGSTPYCFNANCVQCRGIPYNDCETDECCIDGECVEPICGNCHYIFQKPFHFYECGHYENDIYCNSNWCIDNIVVNMATCNYKGHDWPCNKSKCDTYIVPNEFGTAQLKKAVENCPTGGEPVNLSIIITIYVGCSTDCITGHGEAACIIESCDGDLIDVSATGAKTKCGCP